MSEMKEEVKNECSSNGCARITYANEHVHSHTYTQWQRIESGPSDELTIFYFIFFEFFSNEISLFLVSANLISIEYCKYSLNSHSGPGLSI